MTNDNQTEIDSQNESDSGVYVLVNKTLDENGDKVRKPFQDASDPVELDALAEARKIELVFRPLPNNNDGVADTYKVKLKLESEDSDAHKKTGRLAGAGGRCRGRSTALDNQSRWG